MGTLYIVATPIGNLSDMTSRAILTLQNVSAILCEDTRQTKKLLDAYEIKNKRLIAFNDFNEESILYEALELLQSVDVALVSDAGTPLISDPGFKLVREAGKKDIKIVPIPGASSVISALSASGLPTDKFMFLGFPPDSFEKKKNFFIKVKNSLEILAENKLNPTIVIFESPHKLHACLEALENVFGDIEVTIAREMTKIHEEFLKDTVSNLRKHFEVNKPKGEFVVLFRILQ